MPTGRAPKRYSLPQRRSPRLSKLQQSPSCEEGWVQAPRGADLRAAASRGEAAAEGRRAMNGWHWTFMAVCAAVFVGSIVIVATVPTATKAEMRLCDKAVSTV